MHIQTIKLNAEVHSLRKSTALPADEFPLIVAGAVDGRWFNSNGNFFLVTASPDFGVEHESEATVDSLEYRLTKFVQRKKDAYHWDISCITPDELNLILNGEDPYDAK